MATETIVAVFDTVAHAEAAIAALVSHGIPTGSIEHYVGNNVDPAPVDKSGGTLGAQEQEPRGGLWSWLTGEPTATMQHHALYDQSIRSGSTIVTVISDGINAEAIHNILEAHNPVDLEERHSQYVAAGTYGDASPAVGTSIPATQATTDIPTGGVVSQVQVGAEGEQVVSLSEETLVVGKRMVDRGTTRVRRYVVERPIEEQVRLRDETVTVFRRPVTAGVAVGADAFTSREIAVTTTEEEVVVGKTAHVFEEVVVQRNVQERVETVHDTVRREDVEIESLAPIVPQDKPMV